MPSRSRFAKRSSTSARSSSSAFVPAALVGSTALAATGGGLGLAIDSPALAAAGLIAATAFAGAFAVFLIVSERRRHEFAEDARALGDQVEQAEGITVSTDVHAGEQLGEKVQVALYQLIRDSLNQAVRRKANRIVVNVATADNGNLATEIEDDGMGERRRASIEELDERARVLNGELSVGSRPEGGTVVRVVLPSYVAAPAR